MFGSAIFETVIGMVFVFLAASLAVTACNEILASLRRWRAKDLEAGIERLLATLARTPKEARAETFVKDFKGHALIQSLARRRGELPSYIAPRTFAIVLLDLVKVRPSADLATIRDTIAKAELPEPLRQALGVLLGQAEADVRTGISDFVKLREGVESWFNGAMDRVGGWYKRRAQYVSLALGLGLALALNLDSIAMVESMARDTTLRQGIVAQATQLAQKPPPRGASPAPASTGATPSSDTTATYKELAEAVSTIDELGLPIGWSGQCATLEKLDPPGKAQWWLLKLLGLVLTALAASLGAPFWFDVLSKFISIRAAGKVPEAAPNASPQGAADPKPAGGATDPGTAAGDH